MLILPVEEARVGMVLAAPVTHPMHPDQELLKTGYVLAEEVIAKLRELGVTYIYVDYPGLDDLDRHLAANLSPARQKIYSQIKETIIANQKRVRPAVSYIDYYAATRELVLTLMSQGEHPVYLEHMLRLGTDAVAHATAVAHLSLLLGIKLERYLIEQRQDLPAKHAREVVNLGVAGMLHDMGKLALPEHLQHHTVVRPPADPDDLHIWQSHSYKGYERIRRGVEPSAAAAVLHHHQRWDGAGFPVMTRRNRKQYIPSQHQIHIFARIIAVADLYDRLATRMRSPRRRPNLLVLHALRKRYASWCDPVVLQTLHAIAPPFPPGSILRLNDDTSAVVIDVDPEQPYLPIVRRIIGPDLQLASDRLDLRQPGSPRVTHVGRMPVTNLLPEQAPCAA